MDTQTESFINRGFKLAILLVAGILILILGQIVYQQQVIGQQNQNQITVSGEGKVYAKPDVALVSLGVTTTAKTVAEATKNNTDKMNSVIQAIKDLKIDEKDIQTTNYSLTPVYENYNVPSSISTGVSSMMYPIRSGTTLTGYKLEQNVQVKIRDFAKISDVLSQGTAKGANLVGDLQFTIDNPEQFRQQARAKAIAQAKANAKNLAKESGISLGKIINVYEGYSPSPIMYNSAKAMGGGVAQDSVVAPTIQPGQQEIDVTINLTYKVN
jgi:uncharacterized protein YggE